MSVETTDKIRFIDNTNIDFEHYFDDVIGVTIPKEDVKKIIIELQLTPNQYPYVVSKPLHSSQRIIDEDNRIITIEVRPNYELDHHILSLGPDITVLSPESYRTHIMRKIQDNLNKYLVMQNDCTNNK
jgi:predicted DNA-binding transcriptional regulator YafY